MPVFSVAGRTYNNPVEFALFLIGGKYKMPILWRLAQRNWRYSELKRDLPAASHKMLSQHLRELEQKGLLDRTVEPGMPPAVVYSITPLGQSALPAIEALREWGSAMHLRVEERP